MSVFEKTAEMLAELSLFNKAVLVSYSGGKDSLVVLDLAKKYFNKVVCFYMYTVDNLSFIENQLNYAREKYEVEILKTPHWGYWQSRARGIYCKKQDVPEIKLPDIYRYMMNETGIDLIFTGAKRADSIWRRRHTASIKKMFDNVKNPIYDWSKYEVLAYLKLKNIPIPDNGGRVSSGVDFSFSNLLFIYENYPEDFELMEKQFPFIRAVVKKREYFNGKL